MIRKINIQYITAQKNNINMLKNEEAKYQPMINNYNSKKCLITKNKEGKKNENKRCVRI